MQYTHITLDVGAAEKHYKAIWINPDEFKSLYILEIYQLHDFVHFFSNYGKFLNNGGFEGVISGKNVLWVE